MSDKTLDDNQFFITRQIANLMEDFAREISRSSSVFLLFGDALVGKSRVLNELAHRHFSENVIHRIDFYTDKALADEENFSSDQSSNDMDKEIQQLAQHASRQDLIIFDHFESASNKARHLVFQSWVTDGLDKKLNFIIAADSSHLDEVRQLASQYQVNVKSFQLKPFNRDEIEAFVSFSLFPTESSGRLLMPASIREEFKLSRGLVGKVIEVMSRESTSTAINFDDKPASANRPLILVGILSSILLAVVFLYPLSDQQDELPSLLTDNVISEFSAAKEENSAVEIDFPAPMESATKERSSIEVDESNLQDSSTDKSTLGETTVLLEAATDEKEPGQQLESQIGGKQETRIVEQVDVAPKQLQSNIVNDKKGVAEPAEVDVQELSPFQQELNRSLKWINDSDKNLATIQIMTIGFDSFTDSTYYDFLNELERQDIDVSGIRIYQTRVGGLPVYSIIYGEYVNRREASKFIRLLPEPLNVANPIPRTIGGILDEISNEKTSE